jgi:hypothetical protein
MAVLIILCTFVLIGLIVLVVGAPLREAAARRAAGLDAPGDAGEEAEVPDPLDAGASEREQLEAAREAKYREIRDAELDYRTGKLSERDYRELDAELRAEALTILDALEAAGATAGMEDRPDGGSTPTDA